MSQRAAGEQAVKPDGVCKRVIDFLMNTLLVKSFTRRIPYKSPSSYRHVAERCGDGAEEELASILVAMGKSSEDMNPPEHEVRSEGIRIHLKEDDLHEVTRELPVHFKPHYLDVEPNINEKTDEFIRRRRAAMRQTDSIQIIK